MSIENAVFKRAVPDFDRLTEYGFEKHVKNYYFEKKFMNDEFKAVIFVTENGEVKGSVYDLINGDEYLPLRVENQQGSFVSKVRECYEEILADICDKCFYRPLFINPQSNRISNSIIKKYSNNPVFPWEKDSGYGVFKNPDNNKWYALIMNIDYSKIDKTKSGEIEIINIKLDEKEIQDLLKRKGFFPAWHMNKRTWISIILDDTLNDSEIETLIAKSRSFTLGKKQKKEP